VTSAYNGIGSVSLAGFGPLNLYETLLLGTLMIESILGVTC